MNVRISVANLVPRLVVNETGEVHFVGLLNRKKLLRGESVFGAIGGAAELTDAGSLFLQETFEAEFEQGRDARFVVDAAHLGAILMMFEERDPDFCEVDPTREICEELATNELPDLPPVLSENEAAQIEVRYVKSQHQAGSVEKPNVHASANTPITHRYFHQFEMHMPLAVFDRLRVHPAIRLFTEHELATTQGGLVQGIAADGSVIASNLFW